MAQSEGNKQMESFESQVAYNRLKAEIKRIEQSNPSATHAFVMFHGARLAADTVEQVDKKLQLDGHGQSTYYEPSQGNLNTGSIFLTPLKPKPIDLIKE